ncbi:11406_t:CDS:2, partial [Gigaspora rosea]
YGEPFSLYIFGGVVTFAGVDSMFEVVNNTTAFSFGKNTQTAPIDKIVTPFFRNNQPPRLNQLVREMSSKAKSSNVPRIQKELLFLIEKFFGNCEEPKVFRNIHDTIVQMIAIFTINMALGQDDIFDYFINELQPLDFADDKFMDYLSVHVYLLIYASNLTITKHLTSVLFDYGGRPELWKELYEEQLKIHNELNGNLNIDDVNKMIKLDCFIKESFRHSADIVMETTVPRDRDVILYMQDTNFNNKFYGETSDDFQPKRHITSYSDGNIVYSSSTKIDNSFMFFGSGKHACPGRFYAVNIIKIFLHEMILKYNIRTKSGKIEPPKIISCFYAHLNLDWYLKIVISDLVHVRNFNF